ncbi:hypothetical protein [Stutzerimonas stutzeri]|uniref:hypothetical protein n=1 Tax=Stutzerimonas stutzeri TaxID=316 RepID=UPI00265D60B4|nr:hypothetical protein [Stutzerimonas stutzeri]MCF6783395.1 hypothetical protein [Stutzerimonas stutzeri]
MKIQSDHYKQLSQIISAHLEKNPAMPLEYEALSLSPKRLRWDAVRMAGIRFGDSVGMTRPDNIEPSHFLPVYDYANDDHIDTALRAAFKEAGCDYGSLAHANDAPALVVTEANRVTPAGNFLATLTYEDSRTSESASTTCVVTPDGQVFSYSEIGRLAREGNASSVIVCDIEGDEHEVLVFDDQMILANAADFAARQSIYTVTTYDLVATDATDEDGTTEREQGRWESEAFTLSEIRGEARNLGYTQFNADCLYSTDPSGTREYYEQNINRYHCMQIESINGQSPTIEQMKALGAALSLTIEPQLVTQESKPAFGMSM